MFAQCRKVNRFVTSLKMTACCNFSTRNQTLRSRLYERIPKICAAKSLPFESVNSWWLCLRNVIVRKQMKHVNKRFAVLRTNTQIHNSADCRSISVFIGTVKKWPWTFEQPAHFYCELYSNRWIHSKNSIKK